MTGKENVINAMRSGAKLFLGGYAQYNRLKFPDGSIEVVHGRTVQAVLDTGLVGTTDQFDPWSPMAQEHVLKDSKERVAWSR